ncbi:2'-5' RNA ligase [Fictibacillus macauensis ZFHKF-1]|uniref:RNA 2',3'-cyclic phosphodiesterase n=1 Tax=Fictibacillus macauensis ZFHKF-1 TaxID=1196324 RepID=I8UF59_9BACL|nr:RNA 2',3'-cyclic phosphodiesterase [Fictibacillus macauensis]EIT85510.1 2'-5' RNA ligase [Fictibacillus macauensis ZFHKF-1]
MAAHFFIAIPVSQTVRTAVQEATPRLKGALPYKEWVHEEDLHVTISFLGSVTDQELQQLRIALRTVCHESTSFTLTTKGVGYFGQPTQPRIFYVALDEHAALFTLQAKVQRLCESLGLQVDDRPYTPHITLAKKWKDSAVQLQKTVVDELCVPVAQQTLTVSCLHLYEIKRNELPKYAVIDTFPLGT